MELAKAEGEKIKQIGGAEAYTIEAVGKAEAEEMRLKAAAYKSYGEAAVMSLVLEALPKVRNIWELFWSGSSGVHRGGGVVGAKKPPFGIFF